MGIIGNNDVTDRSSQTTSLPPNHRLNDVDTLACPANQVLTEFHIKSYETSGTAGQTMGLAVYDITSGTNNAPLVTSTSVTIDATTPDVYSVTGLSVDLSSYEGQTLAICVGRESQYNNELAFQDTTGHPRSSTTSVPFDANFAQQDTGAGIYYGVWAVTEDNLLAATTTSVDSDNDVILGQQNVVIATSNVPDPVISWTPKMGTQGGTEVDLTAVSRSGDNFTVHIPTDISPLTDGTTHDVWIEYVE